MHVVGRGNRNIAAGFYRRPRTDIGGSADVFADGSREFLVNIAVKFGQINIRRQPVDVQTVLILVIAGNFGIDRFQNAGRLLLHVGSIVAADANDGNCARQSAGAARTGNTFHADVADTVGRNVNVSAGGKRQTADCSGRSSAVNGGNVHTGAARTQADRRRTQQVFNRGVGGSGNFHILRSVAHVLVDFGRFALVFGNESFGRIVDRIDRNRTGNAGISAQTGGKDVRQNAAVGIGRQRKLLRNIDGRVADFGRRIVCNVGNQNRRAGAVIQADAAGAQGNRKILFRSVILQAFAEAGYIFCRHRHAAVAGNRRSVDQRAVMVADFRHVDIAGHPDLAAGAADNNRVKIGFGVGINPDVAFRLHV